MPILQNFDYKSNPVGYVDFTDDSIILKVNAKEKVRAEDINSGKVVFAPSYVVTKEKDGIALEVTVDSFSLVTSKNP